MRSSGWDDRSLKLAVAGVYNQTAFVWSVGLGTRHWFVFHVRLWHLADVNSDAEHVRLVG
jgi:hypothetical protein